MIARPGLLALLGSLALAAPAVADPVACRSAIIQATAKHAQRAARGLQRCRDRILTGRFPASFDCHVDSRVVAARAKLAASVTGACCGADGTCGTGDDEPLAAIGWAAGGCPDLDSAGCAAPIADLLA